MTKKEKHSRVGRYPPPAPEKNNQQYINNAYVETFIRYEIQNVISSICFLSFTVLNNTHEDNKNTNDTNKTQVANEKGYFMDISIQYILLLVGASVFGAVLIAYILLLFIDKQRKQILREWIARQIQLFFSFFFSFFFL